MNMPLRFEHMAFIEVLPSWFCSATNQINRTAYNELMRPSLILRIIGILTTEWKALSRSVKKKIARSVKTTYGLKG